MSNSGGIIYPPPDLKGIVDSTAKYVAKNGAVFEERIKREHKDKPKFSFLIAGDPFNAYYQHKVNEFVEVFKTKIAEQTVANEEQRKQQQNSEPVDDNKKSDHDDNRNDEPVKESDHDTAKQEQDEQSTVRVRPKLNEYMQEITKTIEEPPPLNFLAAPAPNLLQIDCDIIRLTAQYVAKHGRSFLFELMSREQNNMQFDFLKPQHGQYRYFTNLIMQYSLICNQPLDINQQLREDSENQKLVLERIKMRAEWNRKLESERKRREEAEAKEKLLYSQIDWHDFEIVETIEFNRGEKGEYPPTTADQAGTRLLMLRHLEEPKAEVDMEIEDMDMDDD